MHNKLDEQQIKYLDAACRRSVAFVKKTEMESRVKYGISHQTAVISPGPESHK